jgi:hypothetical protein
MTAIICSASMTSPNQRKRNLQALAAIRPTTELMKSFVLEHRIDFPAISHAIVTNKALPIAINGIICINTGPIPATNARRLGRNRCRAEKVSVYAALRGFWMKNSRPSFFIDAPCFLTRKRGVSHFRPESVRQTIHKAKTLQGNFEAAVFFVTEKHSRFFCCPKSK